MDDETATHLADCRDALPAEPDRGPVAFGFDGFVDNVREMVDKRDSPDSYVRLDRLETFGERVCTSAASDTSFSNEWVQTGTRCGGHVAHLSRAFGRLGYEPTLVGTFGEPIRDEFREEFAEYRTLSLGEPTITDAVEFDDGKILLQDTGSQSTLDWETIRSSVGLETLADAVDGAEILGLGYWANLPLLPTILDGVREELWPVLSDPPNGVFVDPADVRQLSASRLRTGLEPLRRLDDVAPITFSANRGETDALARLTGVDADVRSFRRTAAMVREALGVTRFVGHSPVESVLADGESTYRVAVPRTKCPVLTTSAGDHFNAGLLLARQNQLEGGAALIVGNALSGWFVRHGEPPTYDQLRSFVDTYEDKFD